MNLTLEASMRRWRLLGSLYFVMPSLAAQQATLGPRFLVTYPAARSATPLDGRLLLLLSTDSTADPRMQISDIGATQLLFGRDVDEWRAGRVA